MELKSILEAILFSAQQPLTPKELRDVLAGAPEHTEDTAAKALVFCLRNGNLQIKKINNSE